MRLLIAVLVGCAMFANFPAFSALSPPDDSFVIENSAEAFVDDLGNLELLGFAFDNASSGDLAASASDDFIVKDSAGTNVARISDEGDLFLLGDLIENDSGNNLCSTESEPWNPSGGARVPGLIIRNSLGTSVGWIDDGGNMLLSGTVTENADATTNPAPGDNVQIEIWAPFVGGAPHPEDPTAIWVNFEPEVELRINGGALLGGSSQDLTGSVFTFYGHFEWGRDENEISVKYIRWQSLVLCCGGPSSSSHSCVQPRRSAFPNEGDNASRNHGDILGYGLSPMRGCRRM